MELKWNWVVENMNMYWIETRNSSMTQFDDTVFQNNWIIGTSMPQWSRVSLQNYPQFFFPKAKAGCFFFSAWYHLHSSSYNLSYHQTEMFRGIMELRKYDQRTYLRTWLGARDTCVSKNIANTHRLHDVLLFFKTSIKNRIVKNREEIDKKSHR